MLVDDCMPTYSTMPFPLHEHDSPSPPPPASNFNAENSLDDIFGSEPASPHGDSDSAAAFTDFDLRLNNEPSDIPRLRSEHSTAGYRDGLTAAKGKHIQEGFDEGYSLGAVLGLRIGRIVGVLEGLYNALASTVPAVQIVKSSTTENGEAVDETSSEIERLKNLVEKAKKELKTEEVFGTTWWGEDGIWKFDVRGEDEGEVTFNDVADAHPLLKRWEETVLAEVKRFGIDLHVLAEVEGVEDKDKILLD